MASMQQIRALKVRDLQKEELYYEQSMDDATLLLDIPQAEIEIQLIIFKMPTLIRGTWARNDHITGSWFSALAQQHKES